MAPPLLAVETISSPLLEVAHGWLARAVARFNWIRCDPTPLCDHQTNEIEHVRTTAEARIISNSFPQKHDKGWKSVSLSPFVGETT